MKPLATTLMLGILLAVTLTPALAQPVRNGVDVVWARDVEGAALTLDGILDEAAWDQAEALSFVWNDPPGGLPGSGQRIEGNPVLVEPLDPNNGTLYLLRDGNVLWMGLEVQDNSIGGGRGLNVGNWFFDGFIMSLIDRTARDRINYDGANNFIRPAEWIYGWWHPADTTDGTQTYDDGAAIASGGAIPDIEPRFFGDYGVGFGDSKDAERSQENQDVLQFVTTWDGIANDDTHGTDNGYMMEIRIDLGLLGYDFSREGGDQVPFNFALQDADYLWPLNEDDFFVSRVWFQNQWANNFNEGVAYVYGAPGVTVNSGTAPEVVDPEFYIPNAGAFDLPTIDGNLDEAIWSASDTVFVLQYQADPALMDENPGTVAPYFMRWFRPDINGDGNAAAVVDPSVGRVKMFFEDNILYLGVDADDQAVSGMQAESGRDGIRFIIRDVDSLDTEMTFISRQFDFSVDSTGAIAFSNYAAQLQDEAPGAITAAVHLKGASTVADPTDIDEGYQMEIAIDLTQALGYPDGLGDGRLWMGVNFFDGDFLESQTDSYATRTWISAERADGASIYGFLTDESAVAVDDGAEVPSAIRLYGNYPNPFNPSTTLRYDLPEAGAVTIDVFNVLGQKVAALAPGLQTAGQHRVTFTADGLGSGLYFYRVSMQQATGEVAQSSTVGRMVLVK